MSAPSRSTMSRIEIAGALASIIWATAAPACDLRIITPPSEAVIQYDPFELRQAPADIAFTVRNPGAVQCEFEVALFGIDRVPVQQFDLAQTGLGIDVQTSPGEGQLTRTGTPGIWSGSIAAGATTEFRLAAIVARDAVPLAGSHEEQLQLELRDPLTQALVGSPAPVRVRIVAPARSQMNIAGADGRFGEGPVMSNLDLGVLERGLQRRVFLQIRSNVEFSRLSIESAHDGVLAAVEPGDQAGVEGVSYELLLAGEAVDLSQPHARQVQAPRSLSGVSMPMDIVIGDVAGRMEGRYSDVLTVEISPL